MKTREAITGLTPAHYIVCDGCGRLWDIEASWPDPVICPNCQGTALWRFSSWEGAAQLAHQIWSKQP